MTAAEPFTSYTKLSYILSLLVATALIWSLATPLAAVAIFGVGLAAWLCSLSLRTAVIIFICILPFDVQRQVGSVRLYLDLTGFLLLIPLLRAAPPSKRVWVFGPYILYFIVSTLPRAMDASWFAGFSARWISGLAFCAAVAFSGLAETAIYILGLLILPITFYAIYQLVSGGFGPLFFFLNPHMRDLPWTGRAYSFFWQPNNYGGFCGVVLVALIALLVGREVRHRGFWSIVACLASLDVLLSGSRGALMAAVAGILVISIYKRKFRLVLALLCVAGLVFWIAHTDYAGKSLQRIDEADQFTVETRFLVYAVAAKLFLAHPLIGVGATNFSQMLPSIITWQWDTVPAHNIYIQQLAETGVIGFLLFWIPTVGLIRYAWKRRSEPLMLACAASLIVICTHGLVDYMFEAAPQYLMLFMCICGLVLGHWCQAEGPLVSSPRLFGFPAEPHPLEL